MRKTILLLGAKNSGKTALVNSVTNYLYKIGQDSKYRLHIVGKEKTSRGGLSMEPTTSVHTYVFHGTRVPTSLALVDTPPLGEHQKNHKEVSCTKIKKWYASSYDHPCKDIEIWLVISAQQPSVTKEFMIELKELLEDLDALHIKVTPVITFSKNRKPILAMKALELLGFQTQLENVDYFMVNNESVLPIGGCAQTNALPMKETLRNLRALLINTTEPIVHILGTVVSKEASHSIRESRELLQTPKEELDANNNEKHYNLPKQLQWSVRSQTHEDHIYATPKKTRPPINVNRYPVKPNNLVLQKSISSSQVNLISISPYETVV
ncbi:unnamed protein product, partial [Mesorhabditis belari]|uniref:G domain-containing protein n=1 Tax=Mesorhabditis belari TaxID=2138241 RepID=A0AAF3FPN8_9BILA